MAALVLAAGGALPAAAQGSGAGSAGGAAAVHGLPTIPAPDRIMAKPGVFAALVGGSLLVSSLIDSDVRAGAQDMRSGVTRFPADLGNAFGTPAVVFPALGATWLAGRAFGDARVSHIASHALLATGLAGGASMALKYTVGRGRPEGGEVTSFTPLTMRDFSFPSGHTALAFALATTLAAETPDRWSDLVFYGGATLTAFARVHDDRHWLSDVVGGAAIGFLAGRIATASDRRVPVVLTPAGPGLEFSFRF